MFRDWPLGGSVSPPYYRPLLPETGTSKNLGCRAPALWGRVGNTYTHVSERKYSELLIVLGVDKEFYFLLRASRHLKF